MPHFFGKMPPILFSFDGFMSITPKSPWWAVLLVCLLSVTISHLMLLGSGFFPQINPLALGLLSGWVLLFVAANRLLFSLCLLPVVALYGSYTPIGLTFGAPSYQYVASVFATDLQESREFFSQIPPAHFAAGIAVFFGLFLARILARKHRVNALRNRAFVAALLFVLFFFSPAALFLRESYAAIDKVMAELKRLNALNIESEWGNSQLTAAARYDDYILVIGESARKDYHHAYGYPLANTPFMSSAKGVLIDGLKAGGTNTIASLKLMLTQPDTAKWEGNYALSLVDLVKSAGIKTYWLSNQGYLGKFDTPISSLANKSDEKIFLKAGDSLNQNISDFALLPKFQTLIAQPHQGKRFIVLHLYGSHPISCDRLNDFPKLLDEQQLAPKYANLNCYISSIHKTDRLLAQLYQQLLDNQVKNQRSFSMVYFADHGLAHHISEKSIDIHNSSGKSKLHFDVPLFKISSDDSERKQYQAMKSGLNFTNGIANWIGITNPKLNPEIDLFSPESDKSDYGLGKIIDSFDVAPDPAVVIPTP